ncbi:glutaminyl transferase [Hahella sp. CCB-MM4]|uniref:RimK family protein n=1 Tax=Hahella sp. (strain CCB-MM4) TaxID=1926491 RepID=UPI000B9C09F3|nr:RimK family protein [Hahella sp. CCB-MM4]OZG73527.1 glutaminyl transferase [Hahella sp. CCB-MM4]
MSRLYIVVESLKDWTPYYPSEDVVTFDDYLAMPASRNGRVRVINLCRSYKYLSKGYYCSLLAEARGHHVIPSVRTLNDLEKRILYSMAFEMADPAVAGAFRKIPKTESNQMLFKSYFGTTGNKELDGLASLIFERFACPVTEIQLEYKSSWKIAGIRPVSPKGLDETQQTQFADALDSFSQKVWRKPKERKKYRYDMGILVNPAEEFPPSDSQALKKMVKVGKQMGIAVDMLEPKDYQRVPEYDMLFIRETTAIDHHTFKFSKKAEAEGLIVMDDSTSIMRCTNKVYLADLLNTHKVPTPKTLILSKGDPNQLKKAGEELGFPLVLKIPDGSFSRGVVKAENAEDLAAKSASLFKQSALLLAQEFMFTDFDWRVGVLNGKPIYACKYYMARNHWQIYHHGDGATDSGAWDTLPTYEVPKVVLNAAVKAANLIGKGLYGVDVKQAGDRAAVIEVNDNPSIESGVEDKYLGDELYRIIFEEFIRRVESKRK